MMSIRNARRVEHILETAAARGPDVRKLVEQIASAHADGRRAEESTSAVDLHRTDPIRRDGPAAHFNYPAEWTDERAVLRIAIPMQPDAAPAQLQPLSQAQAYSPGAM